MLVKKTLAAVIACLLLNLSYAQTTISTRAISPAAYCPGASISIRFDVTGTFNSGNVFTAELSDVSGTYVGQTIGSITQASTGSQNYIITGTIPTGLTQGNTYRVRVTSSNPVTAAGSITQSPTSLTMNAYSINAPTFTQTAFCQGATFTIPFTLNGGCVLPEPPTNTFTAELSDNFGNFTSPVTIGTNQTPGTTGTINISGTIPTETPGGNGYRVRIRSTNPGSGLTSASNTSGNITVSVIGMSSPTHGATSYCPGVTFSLTNVFTTSCNFLANNNFTAQLSDASGSFTSPTDIGQALNTTTATSFNVTIPGNTPSGTGYRIRIISSNPVRTSLTSANDITIRALGISAPTLNSLTFCQGSAVTVAYTVQNTCNFPNSPANTFTAQLSNASGSFASPVTLGTLTSATSGTISGTIPIAQAAGSGYRIRVVSSNPSTPVTSPDNGSDITISASSGTPTVYGTSAWNAYVYSGTNATITNNVYLGTYTENNVSFATTSRWASATGPGVADGTSGNAYTGCSVPSTNYSVSFKRTNFTCGYYQIDIPSHDDDVRLFIGGSLVFSHVGGCCDSHTNVWTGFLGPTTQIDAQFINFSGPGNLTLTISAATNPLTVSPTTTICSTASANLTVSSPVSLNYAWTPTTGLSPTTGPSVTAQPSSSTLYTVTGTDNSGATTCTVSKTVQVNVVSPSTVPTITVTNTQPTICSGLATSTLTASGASTYTWTPSTGLTPSSGIGNTVTANPPSTQTYTVTGSTGCQSASQSTTVTVQNIPPSPSTSTFGNNVWNAFTYNDLTLSSYYGYYTETNLGFNTNNRWATASGPSVANANSGLAYQGCTVSAVQYSVSYKRTNFTCGYYQMTVNYQDDRLTMLVNGTQVFQNNAFTSTVQSNVWSGFLGPSSTVELQLVNTGGPGRLDVTFGPTPGPQTVGPDVVICPGTFTPMTSSSSAFPNATFQWSIAPTHASMQFTNPNAANTFLETLITSPNGVYTVTNTMTDVGGTGCTAAKTLTVTVATNPNTAVTPTSSTLVCPAQTVTLTATGANTYTWSPTTGLTIPSGPGNIVTAQPTTTTTYTVTGDNGCNTKNATTTVTVVPLPDYTSFPTNTWNIYGFNSQTVGTNYTGYYTDNGTGTSTYNFNTATRWGTSAAPSTAVASNGNAWQGCAMPVTNYSLSAKRTGFLCGTYTIDIPTHDDNVTILINGVQVAQHNGCCDAHTAMWTGVLTSTSTVEIQLIQGTGTAYLSANFNRTSPSASTTIWVGTTDTNWFTASNWCNAVPTSTIDAIIPAGAPRYPTISALGATTRSITIAPAVAATSVSFAVPAGNLSMGAFNLDVNDSWTNNGTFNAGAGSVSFVGGTAAGTITGTTAFSNVIINKANGVNISSGSVNTVSGTMTFTNGIVTQSGTLRFLNGSVASGANNSSYVVGDVTKVGNTAFTFPTGRGGLYRPIGISAPGTATDSYTAQYYNTSALGTYPNSSRAITLDHVSGAEYWQLTRNSGTSGVNVTLSWDSNSGGVGNLSQLRATGWNGSLWADLGNATTTGNTSAGTITASTATAFSGPFTLASTTPNNNLPVRLAGIQCLVNSFGNPEIKWTTLVEINSDYFAVERAADGKNFESVAHINSQGNSTSTQNYSFEDLNAMAGKVYYRLKQVDLDGKSTYYEVCVLTVDPSNLLITPNPTNNKATIRLHGNTLVDLSVVNSIGQKVNIDFVVKDPGVEIDATSLAPGVYFIRVTTPDKSVVMKLVRS